MTPNTEAAQSAPRARAQRADALRNRAVLLEAASRVIQRDGLTAQMDAIAAEAGLGVGTLYRHFPTKEALLEMLIKERQQLLLERAEAATQASNAWEGFQALVMDIARFEAEDQATAAVLNSVQSTDGCGEFQLRMKDFFEVVTSRAQQAGALRSDITAMDVLAAVCQIGKVDGGTEQENAARRQRLLGVLLDGMRSAPR